MSYEPLHHKYRPQTFKDLVGQETIALTLSNAVERDKIAPAYLFTGPRGTGKTSSARILAKSLNCLHSDKPTSSPCGRCEVCLAIALGTALDVMEIDAASNTGVDNIREIIERCRFAPVQCRYKVYAIDECHMLSTAAFNALLKTLEEPPLNVVFILATTDPQRVLPTIISRCQRFDYRRIPLAEMVGHLRYIADRENIAIAEEALTLVAQIANGGLRDAESLLDQLSLLPEKITVEKVWDLVGAVPELDLLKLLKAIKSGRAAEIIQQCRSLLDRGREPLVVLQNLASFYLNLLIAKTAPNRSEMVAVTESCWQELRTEAANWETPIILQGQQQLKAAETQLKQTTQPRLWLEITLLGLLSAADVPVATPNAAKTTNGSIDVVVDKSPPIAASVKPNSETKRDRQEIKETDAKLHSFKPETDSNRDRNVVRFNPPPSNDKNERANNNSNQQDTQKSEHLADKVAENKEEIWNQVIQCLQPPTTQALLRQQCHLISLEGSRAIVGIGSAKLQRLHQGKVTNIETAFAKVCQRIVKVKLEVATPKKSPAKDTAAPSSVNMPASESETQPNQDCHIEPSNYNRVVTSDRVIEPDTYKNVAALPTPKKNLTKPIASPPPVTKEVAPPSTDTDIQPVASLETTTPDFDFVEDAKVADDLQRAIADLTLSFEGELVQLDNLGDRHVEPDLSITSLDDNFSESQAELPSDKDLNILASSNKIVIKRQQDLDDYDEDEDVPF